MGIIVVFFCDMFRSGKGTDKIYRKEEVLNLNNKI